jgi:hypothetical protein
MGRVAGLRGQDDENPPVRLARPGDLQARTAERERGQEGADELCEGEEADRERAGACPRGLRLRELVVERELQS